MAKPVENKYLENLVIYSAGALWLTQMLGTVLLMALEWPNNRNMSAYMLTSSWAVGPLVVAILLYVSRRNRRLSRRMFFEVVSGTIAVVCVVAALLRILIPLSYYAPISDKDSTALVYAFLPGVVTLVLTALAVVLLRRSKSW